MRLFQKAESSTSLRDLFVVMVDENDRVTPETGLTLTTYICKAGETAFSEITGTSSGVSDGVYKISLSVADLDTRGEAMIMVTATGAANQYIPIQIIKYIYDIDAMTVTVTSPVANDDSVVIYKDDDYDGDHILTWTIADYTGYDVTDGEGAFYLLEKDKYNADITEATVTLVATLAMDGDDLSIEVEIANDDLTNVNVSPPNNRYNYQCQVRLTTSDSKVATLIDAPVTVKKGLVAPSAE